MSIAPDIEAPTGLTDSRSEPRLRVLHLVSYFPPDRIGGVGEVVGHLHRGLLERGHDSHVLTTGTSHDDPRVVRVASKPGRYAFASALRSPSMGTFDIVHAQHGEAAPLLAMSRLGRSCPPTLLTMHVCNRRLAQSGRPYDANGRRIGAGWASLAGQRLRGGIKRALDLAAMRTATQLSFIARSAAMDVLGPSGVDARVIYNGLPQLAPDRLPSHDVERTELLYVGNNGPRKRAHILPAVLAEVRRRHPAARLRIVGFHLRDDEALQRSFDQMGLSRAVISEGPLPSSEIVRFYRAADVLVLPSAYEGLPMVILEAYQCGLPCVATDAGGVREIIEDGYNGMIAPVDNVERLAAAVTRVLDDSEAAQRMGRLGQQIVATRFTVRRQVDAYTDLYAKMLGAGAGAAPQGYE